MREWVRLARPSCARSKPRGGAPIFSVPLFTDPWFYAAAIPAVIVLGLAKGGFSGLGVLAVPILSLVMSPVQAAAITLPILIAQDVVSLWVFRGHWDLKLAGVLTAGGVIGVWLGYAFAANVSRGGVALALGVISGVFAGQRLWEERHPPKAPPVPAPIWTGGVFGLFAGFTSQIAHAGGPPAYMFLLSRRLERDVFIGTGTLFFALINWIKVPAYVALNQFTPANLMLSGVMLPLAAASTFAGAFLARRLHGPLFFRVAYVLMLVLGLKLTWDGAAALLPPA